MIAKLSGRLTAVLFVLALIFLFSIIQKNHLASFQQGDTDLMLSRLPEVKFYVPKQKKYLSSSELKNYNFKLLVVHIWATWCGPCEAEFPSMLKLISRLDDKVLFALIAVKDEEENVIKFIERFDIKNKIIIGIDKNDEIMNKFGIFKIPETFIFDSNLLTIKKFQGPQEWDSEKFDSMFTKLLNRNYIER